MKASRYHRRRPGHCRHRAVDRVRHLLPHERPRAAPPSATGEARGQNAVPRRRVAGRPEMHVTAASSSFPAAPRPTSACAVTARTGGVLTELRVKRGRRVKKGEIIAVLSDEAREAQVAQAQARGDAEAHRARCQAPLILNGTLPRSSSSSISRPSSRPRRRRCRRRGRARPRRRCAPRGRRRARHRGRGRPGGVLVAGREIAQLVALDPMLAVVEVAERKLGGIKVGDAPRCGWSPARPHRTDSVRRQDREPATRTYRVEVEMPNADGQIPDGITAEVDSARPAGRRARCRARP